MIEGEVIRVAEIVQTCAHLSSSLIEVESSTMNTVLNVLSMKNLSSSWVAFVAELVPAYEPFCALAALPEWEALSAKLCSVVFCRGRGGLLRRVL